MSLEKLNPLNWNVRSHFKPYTIEGTGEDGKVDIKKIPHKPSDDVDSTLYINAQLKITETGKVFELWLKGTNQISIREVTDDVQTFTIETEADGTPKEFKKVENVIVIDAKSFRKCAEVAVGSDSKVVEAFKTLLQQNQSYRITNAARSLKQGVSSIKVPDRLKSKWVTTPLKVAVFAGAAVASGYALTHFEIISGPIKYACNFAAPTAPVAQKGYVQLGFEGVARMTSSLVSGTGKVLSCLKFW